MGDFEEELKAGFLEEADQLLNDAEQCFLTLEANPSDRAILEKIFRLAHNIKGSSKAVGFDELGKFTHEFESFLLRCKSGEIPILPDTVSLLLKCNDHLNKFVNLLKTDQKATLDSSDLISELKGFVPSGNTQAIESTPEPEPQAMPIIEAENVASEVPAIDSQTQAEALASIEGVVIEQDAPVAPVAPVAPQNADYAQDLAVLTQQKVNEARTAATLEKPKSTSNPQAGDESIRVSLSRLEKLLNFVGEMVILQTVLKEQAYSDSPQLLRRTIHQMGKVTKEIQDLSMSLRMVPLKQTFQKMQRIVRDTSSLLGKKVNLILEGEETEVDKTVLEALGDPLVHLVRNAVDHGIESADARKAAGKIENGTIILRSYHQSGKLIIEVKDDGGGISPDRLRQKAIEKGILKPGQTITDKEAINLIFHPGFSTKAQVTEVSGRGVGMDVVKTNIEQLQGEIDVETTVGNGSTFRVVLPLTLAIIDGMVVSCEQDRFIIPLSHVHESVKPQPEDLQYATGLGEVLHLRGENLPVVRLAQALGKRKKTSEAPTEKIAVIVRSQGKPFAALVDDIVGQHQVVIKKLGAEIQNVKGYSGSAILGDGKPALILELGELVSSKTAPGRRLSA